MLLAPNRFVLQFIKDRFLARIEALASEVLGEPACWSSKIGAPVKVEPPVMTSFRQPQRLRWRPAAVFAHLAVGTPGGRAGDWRRREHPAESSFTL